MSSTRTVNRCSACPRQDMKEVNFGGRKQMVPVYTPVVVNPNEKLDEQSELKAEVELLPKVAALAKQGLVTFAINIETHIEVLGIPDLDSRTGFFYGAAKEFVEAPVRYGRVLFGAPESAMKAQVNFLEALTQSRFLELRRVCGAQQGTVVNRNQLLDAFHLWCAEHNECEYFLSLDFKLARIIERSKVKPRCRIVKSSELLAAVSSAEASSA